jgi:diphthamide biosynthesis protein 7
VTTLHRRDTSLHADCVESCPISGFEHLMAVGTYHLTKHDDHNDHDDDAVRRNPSSPDDTRQGSISLYAVEADGDVLIDGAIRSMQSGVFDMKWSTKRLHDHIVLAVATAAGTLELLSLDTVRCIYMHEKLTPE